MVPGYKSTILCEKRQTVKFCKVLLSSIGKNAYTHNARIDYGASGTTLSTLQPPVDNVISL